MNSGRIMPEKAAIPTAQVDSSALAPVNTPGLETNIGAASHASNGDMSISGMFMNADIIVQLVMIMLLLASFWCWTIILSKLHKYRSLKKKMNKFEDEIWAAESLESKYEQIKHKAEDPLTKVFVAGMYEWVRAMSKSAGQQTASAVGQNVASIKSFLTPKTNLALKAGIKERIFHSMDATRNREVGALEKNLSFLATVGSTAPFVGLFGTVWGIMNSFQSIAMTKNTTLAVVAPGIAEALFATAVGLFAAIPAVIFYNKFANDVAGIAAQMDNFADELGGVMARELDE